MTSDTHSAREDLAFMRGLVEDDGRGQMAFGIVYMAGGLLYGLQLAASWLAWSGRLKMSDAQMGALVAAVNLVFLAVIVFANLRYRPGRAGLAARGVNAAFGGVAAAVMTLAAVFAFRAEREHSLVVWQLFGSVAFALQGGAWLSSYMLRRRGWQALVALGWLAAAVLCGWFENQPAYALTAFLAFLFCMALPGYLLVRLARRQA